MESTIPYNIAQSSGRQRTTSAIAGNAQKCTMFSMKTAGEPPKKFHFGRWLRSRIKAARKPISTFRDELGASQSTVYSWLNNESPEIYDYNQSKIAEAVGTTAEVVAEALELAKSGVYEVDANRRLSTVGRPTQVKARGGEFDTNVEPYSIVRLIAPIPTFDLPIAAGAWADVSGQIEITDARQIEQGLFRVHVRGDSMQPKYPDGCIVEFRIVRRGRDGWPIGKNCYVQLASGDATFKRMEAVDEDTVTLVAINSAKYKKPLTAAVSDVVSMAVAMGTFSPD